jgi:hypothetical protein
MAWYLPLSGPGAGSGSGDLVVNANLLDHFRYRDIP